MLIVSEAEGFICVYCKRNGYKSIFLHKEFSFRCKKKINAQYFLSFVYILSFHMLPQ